MKKKTVQNFTNFLNLGLNVIIAFRTIPGFFYARKNELFEFQPIFKK